MTTIQNRRGTSAQWTAKNPVLAQGEIGYETDTGKFKMGDGATAWSALGYVSSSLASVAWEDLVAALSGKVHRWKFEETSGTTLTDSIGSLPLTLSGTYTLGAASPVGNAVTFGAAAKAVSSGLGSIPVGGAARTFVAVYQSTSTAKQSIVSYGPTGTTRGWWFAGFNSSGKEQMCLLTWSDDANAGGFVTGDSNWHVAAWGYDPTSAVGFLYQDGYITGAGFGGPLGTGNSGNLQVGLSTNSDGQFSGSLADLIAFNRVLSKAELDRLYQVLNNASSPAANPMIATAPSITGQPGRVLLKEFVLSADTASVTFDSSMIPTSGYRDLVIESWARSSMAANEDDLALIYNGDTTAANYVYKYMYSVGTTITQSSGAGAAAGSFNGANAPAGTKGFVSALISNYTDTTTQKVARGDFASSGSDTRGTWDTRWKNTAAITSIQVKSYNGNNLLAGSRIALYGLVDATPSATSTSLVKDRRWVKAPASVTIDEFNDSSLDPAWVRVDGTGAPATNAVWTEGADTLSVLRSGAETTSCMNSMVRPITTVAVGDAFETHLNLFAPNANYAMAGIILSDGATYGSGNQVLAQDVAFSDGSQKAQTHVASGFNTTVADSADQGHPKGATFLRLVYTATNTWRTDVSPDGVTWIKGTTQSATITPTYAGFFVRSNGTTTTYVAAFEYLRRVSGVS